MKVASEEQIVDVTDSNSSASRQVHVKLDAERVGEVGLSVPEVSAMIQGFLNPSSVSIIHQENGVKEEGNILIGFPRGDRQDVSTIKALSFTNPKGEKIRLDDIAAIDF